MKEQQGDEENRAWLGEECFPPPAGLQTVASPVLGPALLPLGPACLLGLVLQPSLSAFKPRNLILINHFSQLSSLSSAVCG